ncbi:carbohydrate ABC transporter permease [Paenibacillus thalictri]|uniref:Carbohydrate ABC transporter permease n=1 Tax=Paenibacillus thalictri TaxID=2527873 RepID=A0A4Q9DFA0_9BACL|nr:carbohydrate ABC transporter permease [Paenibacillus thalictri]TBL70569.1 carbohydrate ABC transporter permease [Paenibacillus thalictri]
MVNKISSGEDRIVNTLVYVLLGAIGLCALFPMLYVFSASVTPYSEVLKNGGFVIIPTSLTWNGYKQLFQQAAIPKSLHVSVYITVVGTLVNMVLTTLMAYPLSRKDLPGRGALLFTIIFTFIFSGGIIPTYLIVKNTGLLNTVWAMIIPNAIWSYNVLIMKSFFDQLPEEIYESAKIDGAKELRILLQITVPLSVPVILTLSMFYAVSHWNEFFQAIMYVSSRSLYPLQVVVRDILTQSASADVTSADMVPTLTLQMAAVVMASLPIILVYPLIQKHFTKGMMLGSVKG